MVEASVKNNCKGILKSFVSKIENLFYERRNVYKVTGFISEQLG